uniref:Uncharacterized protein n=1 Tax=Globodera rostochiensis TaxID=31243 RepID=A0A914HFG5_GLORO
MVFVNATEPVNFIIHVLCAGMEPFELENNLTGERLSLRRFNELILLLVRCPIEREEAKWPKFESDSASLASGNILLHIRQTTSGNSCNTKAPAAPAIVHQRIINQNSLKQRVQQQHKQYQKYPTPKERIQYPGSNQQIQQQQQFKHRIKQVQYAKVYQAVRQDVQYLNKQLKQQIQYQRDPLGQQVQYASDSAKQQVRHHAQNPEGFLYS